MTEFLVPQPRALARTLSLGILMLVLAFVGVARGSADNYPLPTHGDGTVSRSVVHVGECTVFSGGGFKPHSTVTITDNGKVLGTTQTDRNGNFSYTVCYSTDSTLGRHTLTGSGTGANGAARTVSAVVTVVGAESLPVKSDAGTDNGDGGGLPFTGADILGLALMALALIALGWLLVARNLNARAARRRVRRQRGSALA